ncbi:60S ribosomal protein [Mycena kentingensis (nom. inval.)]|nr:60S ribosomal protein [Mycena kentingensis (nom. inval.)]
MGRRAKHYTLQDRQKSQREYEASHRAKAIRTAYRQNHPRRSLNPLEKLGLPALTPEIVVWADFDIPFSRPVFQRGCVIDVNALWPYILPPPYHPSDFETCGKTRTFCNAGELELMVHGALLREEREKERQLKEDWDSGSAAQSYLELCRARLGTFLSLRRLMDEEEEDAEVDEISVYTRAMTQLHYKALTSSLVIVCGYRCLFFVPFAAGLDCVWDLRMRSATVEKTMAPAQNSKMMAGDTDPHVGRLSRSGVFSRRALYKGQKKSAPVAPVDTPATVEKTVGGAKNGGKRLVPTPKASRFYPADDVRQPKKSRKSPKPTALRSSITPGTVLILLAGRFHGNRVVFLKQLASDLLLVTGPFKINGVPLRRVNQAYVIATSTKIDLEGFTVDEKLNDAYFAKSATKGAGSAEAEFFEGGKPKAKEVFPESKAADRRAVDKATIASAKKTENLVKYLVPASGCPRASSLMSWSSE